jgi:predicted ribosome quality control (RQC) complex YloA/Tae2 family protein
MACMKSYSFLELKKHVLELQSLVGAQLQDIETHSKGLAFSLYKRGQVWWILDLNQQTPMSLVFYAHSPWGKKQTPKPVALFLNSHAKNLFLSKVTLKKDLGRVIEVEWVGSQNICQMEIHLVPKAVNIIVNTQEKSISWEKVKDMGLPPQIENESDRDLADIKAQWLEQSAPRSQTIISSLSIEDWEKQKQKNLIKKRKAIEELEKQLAQDLGQKWQSLGELLKSFEISELGSEWKEFLTRGIGRYEQMELAFSKAKQLEGKKAGTRNRLDILQNEIHALELQVQPPPAKIQNKSSAMLKSAGADGRIKRFGPDQQITASRGKSAADNMALLRKAKAWDIWVHLRDYPSTHAIVSLDKNQKLSDSILRDVALWVATETKASQKLPQGSRLDVVVAECRYVRPIKGDKLGRVHYQNERVLTVVIP